MTLSLWYCGQKENCWHVVFDKINSDEFLVRKRALQLTKTPQNQVNDMETLGQHEPGVPQAGPVVQQVIETVADGVPCLVIPWGSGIDPNQYCKKNID